MTNSFEEGSDEAKEALDLGGEGNEEFDAASGGDVESIGEIASDLQGSGGDVEFSGGDVEFGGDEGTDSGGDVESEPESGNI